MGLEGGWGFLRGAFSVYSLVSHFAVSFLTQKKAKRRESFGRGPRSTGATRRRERTHALVKKLEDGFGREFGERLEGLGRRWLERLQGAWRSD